ncbi:MAG: RIP metalloprotease RseP [Deltaproteobacteria bacterium]|nr:RIP metalloprotease RseP [Deltaproteobacteria bacterium]MBW2595551.1 RIP metalloprotease RseP [Deltaproteobacteria bacterium]MBW2650010.1 RIP metalloprotease RseP [Deltaproteobacteria bacterium]
MNIISVIILLGILIFVHELGHFLVAKWSGVGVLKFSLGFGPRLVGKKVGETEYVLSAIPLGGYVKMLGESGDEEELSPDEEKRSFQKQSVLKKIAIVAAGPLFNFLFAIIAFAVVYAVGVPVSTSRIGDVQEAGAAFEAGMQSGDVIVAINDMEISRWSELANVVSGSSGDRLRISVDRGNKFLNIHVTPELVKSKNLFGEEIDTYRIGVGISDETFMERQGPMGALYSGVKQTWAWTKLTCLGIVKIVQGVVSPKELGGPILIAQMAGSQVRKGFLPFIFLMAVLSVNLGVLNLLPVPVLDGGHLCFFLIEAVTGREVNIKWREVAQQVGFFLLILLMIFVFYNDIARILSN